MIEQYVYNLITEDPTLQDLLNAGSGGYHVYPNVVPRGTVFERALTFTVIVTQDAYPTIQVVTVQFNIFGLTHSDIANVAKALADVFNGDHRKSSGGLQVVSSIRTSESDLGYNFDDKLYQREASYKFDIR